MSWPLASLAVLAPALAAGFGRRHTRTVVRAAAFLAARQNADGGMALSRGGASNAPSTAWPIQVLVAAGRDPARVRRRGACSPLAYVAQRTAP